MKDAPTKEAAADWHYWVNQGYKSAQCYYHRTKLCSFFLMIYANIIKDRVLYIYAKGRKITHVAVLDPTTWSKRDVRPAAGNKLIR